MSPKQKVEEQGISCSPSQKARVLSASRRHLFINPGGTTVLKATAATKALNTTIGDIVSFSECAGNLLAQEIVPRKNIISRSFKGHIRDIAANLDHLFVVAAVLPLFNTIFIDRIITVASVQQIPVTLLINKIDLGVDETSKLIDVYTRLGFHVLLTSARYGEGLEPLYDMLKHPSLNVTAFAGVSGVGKSTFLNQFIPDASQKTSEVSGKTGQGRQTTTQATGFLYERPGLEPLLMIDLPGIHQFGVSHLTSTQVADTFPEIVKHREACEFSDCAHVHEDNCGVKKGVQCSDIADCRYQSYLHMLDEIERERPY